MNGVRLNLQDELRKRSFKSSSRARHVPFSPQRGEGGRRPDEGWARLRLRFLRRDYITSVDVISPHPLIPLPIEGRGRHQSTPYNILTRYQIISP
jgi:hypothetical protein